MKQLFLFFTILLLPCGLRAQVLMTPRPPAAHDTAEWTVAINADQRTYYLGREYGDHSLAVSPSVIYSHPSGFYGQVSGYYFHQSVPPHYSFTDLEVGFANSFTQAWTYSLSLDRVFFTQALTSGEPLINNGLEANTAYSLGPFNLALDYNFFFQKQKAQTIALALNGTLKKEDWLGADAVSLSPGAEIFWGSPLAGLRYGGAYDALVPGTRRRKGRAGTVLTDETATPSLMGYELTLPLAYTRYPFAYTLTGHYIAPVRANAETEPLPRAAYASFRVDFTFR